MGGQSTTAAFAAKGIDVTPNKDQGVIKVFIVFVLEFYFRHSSTSFHLFFSVWISQLLPLRHYLSKRFVC